MSPVRFIAQHVKGNPIKLKIELWGTVLEVRRGEPDETPDPIVMDTSSDYDIADEPSIGFHA